MSEVLVFRSLLTVIRSGFEEARSGLESCAASVPVAVDGGDLTPLLTGMLAHVIDGAASMSEGMAMVSGAVGLAGVDLWTADGSVVAGFGGGVCHVD